MWKFEFSVTPLLVLLYQNINTFRKKERKGIGRIDRKRLTIEHRTKKKNNRKKDFEPSPKQTNPNPTPIKTETE
jgi:hypothetical protein